MTWQLFTKNLPYYGFMICTSNFSFNHDGSLFTYVVFIYRAAKDIQRFVNSIRTVKILIEYFYNRVDMQLTIALNKIK